MFDWIMENIWNITLIAGGFYLLVTIAEKIVNKRKLKKVQIKDDSKEMKKDDESEEIV